MALVLGGQNPITLEYQIYPPPIDTLVTGMHWTTDTNQCLPPKLVIFHTKLS